MNADGWGTSTDTSDCQNTGFIKEGLGGDVFSLLSGFGLKPTETNGEIPSGSRPF